MSAEQLRIDYDPAPVPLLPLCTPREIAAAHKPQTLEVLRMLQRGPCTTGDFLRACIGRFGARIEELRAVGWLIERKAAPGSVQHVYTLIGRSFAP